ncbi:acetyl-CoA C-acetyltransferase [Gordonia sp. SID5947]|uniref:acetyl-CoA C-acetyltransferase n=1 Tax=Gordonia sp. SID5947 TaxID=2690315 RepID=UPI00136CB296|nr:acetyl-CoA C-acetyltransferase [Gordonia sp. SID5947]MYR08000.1 acetyl-CoA C-acetyltransferase [Gordonia sp. SID5947]
MTEAVIASYARSPIGRAFKGSLREMRPDDMAAQMVTAALAKVPELAVGDVNDLIVGNAGPAGPSGFNMGRVISVLLDQDGLPGTTVNRYCASSLQTTRMAMHAIRAGEGDVYISAGVESVSSAALGPTDIPGTENPLFSEAMARSAERAASGDKWVDPRVSGRLPDVYIGMGLTAENVAELDGISRADQDAWAERSQRRTKEAIERGFYAREISPLTLADGSVVEADDSPRPSTTLEGLAGLNPAFRENGTVTAGNACPLNDGAAAVVVMSDTKAAELGITPLARIVATSVTGLSPEIMGLGPVGAVEAVLASAGLSVADIDLFEINEAFASQVLGSIRRLKIDEDRVNVSGGAIALGHPFGMTGARITATLLNNMAERDARFGIETMCVGGGQGMAMLVERLS